MQTFKIEHENIPGLNEMLNAAKKTYAVGNRKKSKAIYTSYESMKKLWIGHVVVAIREADITPVDKCSLELLWGEPSKRRDPDNIAAFIKFILDGMQTAEIIKNDGWNQIMGWKNYFSIQDKRNVTVRIFSE